MFYKIRIKFTRRKYKYMHIEKVVMGVYETMD